MIIAIDDELIGLLDTEYRNDVLITFQEIALSARKGYHHFYGSSRLLGQLSHLDALSEIDKNIFKKLHILSSSRYPPKLPVCARIVAPGREESCLSKDGGIEIQIPLNLILSNNLISIPPYLLVENLDDAEMYRKIAHTYLIWNKLGNVRIHFSPDMGGGSTIHTIFERRVNERVFCLSLVDSDMKYPGGGYGSTAQNISNVRTNNYTKCNILSFREVENLIPLHYLNELALTDFRILNVLSILRNFERTNVNARFFFDMKSGLTLGKVLGTVTDRVHPNETIFWLDILRHFGIRTNCNHTNSDLCSKNRSRDCDCRVLDGFGDALLSRILNLLKYKSPHEFARNVEPELKNELHSLGEIICSWFYAAEPIRVD